MCILIVVDKFQSLVSLHVAPVLRFHLLRWACIKRHGQPQRNRVAEVEAVLDVWRCAGWTQWAPVKIKDEKFEPSSTTPNARCRTKQGSSVYPSLRLSFELWPWHQSCFNETSAPTEKRLQCWKREKLGGEGAIQSSIMLPKNI